MRSSILKRINTDPTRVGIWAQPEGEKKGWKDGEKDKKFSEYKFIFLFSTLRDCSEIIFTREEWDEKKRAEKKAENKKNLGLLDCRFMDFVFHRWCETLVFFSAGT